MKIIVTRPDKDGEAFAAALNARGVEALISPVMTIIPRQGPIEAGDAGAFAFTSANGVRAAAAKGADRGTPVFAVGAATALAAQAAGFGDVTAASGDVSSLAHLIATAKPRSPVVHFAGREQAGDLVAALGERGLDARRIVLYDALPVAEFPAAVRRLLGDPSGEFGVALFSARSARLFLDQASRNGARAVNTHAAPAALSRAIAFCLSPQVAAALADASWREVLTAPAPTAEAMADLIEARAAGRK